MKKYNSRFYNSVSQRGANAAQIVANTISKSIKPMSIIDIGSGEGIWLNTMAKKFPRVKYLMAVDLQNHDSSYLQELRNLDVEFEFKVQNFEISTHLPGSSYDLAICLEVLEHLNKHSAEKLAKEISDKCSLLIFSAAMKGQGGTHHINEQPLEYWVNLFTSLGYVPLDVLRPALTENAYVANYYKFNMLIFWHPENTIKNNTSIDIENLLTSNLPFIKDIRPLSVRVRYGIVKFLPAWAVTNIVKFLDGTFRKIS